MIYIYNIPVYEEKGRTSDIFIENLNKNNILSAFKAIISKKEVRNEFENLLYAEVQKIPDLSTEAGERISKEWISSCLECMPGEIVQRISDDKDVIDLVMNNLTMPTVEKIKKALPQRKKLFQSSAKANCTMFDRAIYGAAMFNTAILDEALAMLDKLDDTWTKLDALEEFYKG